VIRCAGWLFAALQVLTVGFSNLRYFFPQLCNALFDGPRHRDSLTEDVASRQRRSPVRFGERNTIIGHRGRPASPNKASESPLRPTAVLENYIKPAALRAGLGSDIGWHTFRHTYSSTLRQLGVDLKVQQELLRHADVRTTMNVYTQAVSEQKRAAHSRVVRMVLAWKEQTA
jgi:integrase